MEEFLRVAHEDPKREEPLGQCEDTMKYETPKVGFNDNSPPFNEFAKKLRKTRTKSSPGPNGVPYVVYKRCPRVARLLWGYLKELWIKNVISDAWREAEGVFIPKEDGANSVDKF